MKCTVARDRLLPVLTVIGDVVPTPAAAMDPMMAHILLDLHDGRLSVCGTDTAREITASMPVEEEGEAGRITVPGRTLLDMCKSLTEGSMLQFTLRDKELSLDSKSYHGVLPILDAEGFPENSVDAEQDGGDEFELPVELLADALRRTHFCIAHNNARKFLNGLLWDIKDGKINLVASDGHRMALAHLGEVAKGVKDCRIILPDKGVQVLQRMLGHMVTPSSSGEEEAEEGATLKITARERSLRLVGKDLQLVAALIDSDYPPYEPLIPSGGTLVLEVDRTLFLQALRRASVLSEDLGRGGRQVQLDLSQNRLRVMGRAESAYGSGGRQQAEETMAAKYSGDAFTVRYNSEYLQSVLDVTETQTITLTFVDAERPVHILDAGKSEVEYIIMPRR